MKTSGLLDQLLKSGQDLLQKQQGSVSRSPATNGTGSLGDMLSGAGGPLGSILGGVGGAGKGALATGALGMLLGSRSGRRMGGKVVTYGGLAALGMLAYKAYGNWQAQQAQQAQQGGAMQPTAARAEPKTVDRLPPEQVEEHSRGILKALVAAAKADGHVDDQEQQMIEAELAQLTDDPELRRWLEAELNKPLDPVEVAAAATTPEMASEMYLASVLMVDEEQYMERAYLDELARQMKLDDQLKAELESQVRGISA
ncbi:tellurite resistance TerB family protein [Stutzerimonas zhaodongensis]|uniref:Tellurite resistance TerB family protein n=1 Tax=Stutzerimonas zhaodongensis TaxID=1176257 RepID=A0A3M2HTY9_9GAMM|nr:tellurite resistance TerB family protein [Stutzerimonas zhaodongensis]MCQ4316736.1 tellurite resistance TerB family protein [Stutzerimonas zhaodongensis]RMH92488.1 tellurite resistance TerB family protein [Stutzerimonas zhaodongensis]